MEQRRDARAAGNAAPGSALSAPASVIRERTYARPLVRPVRNRRRASAASHVPSNRPKCMDRKTTPSPVKYPPSARTIKAIPVQNRSRAHIVTATHQAHRCSNQRPTATPSGSPARNQRGGSQIGRSVPATAPPRSTPAAKDSRVSDKQQSGDPQWRHEKYGLSLADSADQRRSSGASARSAGETRGPRGGLLVGVQDRVHPSLPARALGAEPPEDLGVYAQGDRFLRRLRLQAPPDDAPNDVRRVGFGVPPPGLDVPVLLGADSCPISSRCSQGRFCAHAWSPFALR